MHSLIFIEKVLSSMSLALAASPGHTPDLLIPNLSEGGPGLRFVNNKAIFTLCQVKNPCITSGCLSSMLRRKHTSGCKCIFIWDRGLAKAELRCTKLCQYRSAREGLLELPAGPTPRDADEEAWGEAWRTDISNQLAGGADAADPWPLTTLQRTDFHRKGSSL